MSYKIAFFDIDGTLVNEEKVIPQDTIDAIGQLKKLGIEPVIATGRAPYFIQSIIEQVGIESYVCLNGGYAVYKGQPIHRHPISAATLEGLVNIANEHNHALCFEGETKIVTDQPNHPYVIESVSSLKVDLPQYNVDLWKQEPVFQVFLHALEHEEALYDSLKTELTFIRWHDKALDVLPKDSSKAVGIAAMLKQLGLTKNEAIAFGDNLNDKEMLEYVGFGVAMGNSNPELLPYADYITSHVDEKGIRNGLIEAGILSA